MSVVVNLTVDAKNNAFVFVNERLGTTVCKPKITRLDAGYQKKKTPSEASLLLATPIVIPHFPQLTDTNNSKTLVSHDMVTLDNTSWPIGTTMSNPKSETQKKIIEYGVSRFVFAITKKDM